MKQVRQHLNEQELTAWVLIAIFLTALLVLSSLFWKRVSPEVPRATQSQEAFSVAVYSDPGLPIVRYEQSWTLCRRL